MAVSNPYVIPLSWRNLLLVMGGGLALWALPWLAWPLGGPGVAREPARKPPIFRYVRGTQGLDGSTWSPVLMPLPTPEGFSKKAAIKEMPGKSLVSVLKPRVSEPLYLGMKPPALAALSVPGTSPLQRREFDPESDARSVLGGGSGRLQGGFRVESEKTLKTRQYALPSLKASLFPRVELPAIAMAAYVELDRRGCVQHVLLEQPSGVPAVDSAVVRSLRTGTGKPGAGPTAGHVRIYCWKSDGQE